MIQVQNIKTNTNFTENCKRSKKFLRCVPDGCHIHTHTCQNYSRVSENYTLRVKSHSACGNRNLRVEINLMRAEITLVRVVISIVRVVLTLVSVIITLIRVKITLCV
jgi:hypothetical protein